jgi:hypothetical protein
LEAEAVDILEVSGEEVVCVQFSIPCIQTLIIGKRELETIQRVLLSILKRVMRLI